MTMDEARQIAAQAWCDPETSGIEMDVRLAEAFAKRLVTASGGDAPNYDMSIHSNPDAAAWARFFMETAQKNGWRIEGPDEATMLGWFANAMMAMHDHLRAPPREWVPRCDRCGKPVQDGLRAQGVKP
jgi:hypothetical protein